MKTKREVDGERDIAPFEKGDVEIVTVRVLPKGDGQISSGEHDPAGGDVVYERGDTFPIEKSIAIALEERGFAEIQSEKRGPGRPPKDDNAAVEGE